ncbi:GDSL-type esterase/lipase family protein [Kineococcus rhizosphaerae]|uniref:Lysophospholipase L1-like esterase n=1 Tax=Kineococcus rhizosphaerae TaxID=559628 RepID=A0A2T0QZF3_9ACTN|nr:GDSL-type esterase/lipase family protein [Kineococcus rhizosphaerae]PRY12060.1 lysophospholipase L1-like esterase [Kineococcus rhizosphaerae]
MEIPLTEQFVHGALELERTERGVLPHRLPAWARRQFPDPQLLTSEAQPAGVRIAFRGAVTSVELDVVSTRQSHPGVPPRPPGVFDLRVDGELLALTTADDGRVEFHGLPPREGLVEVWLPHAERTELVACRVDGRAGPVADDRPVWLHHGSSLSQGSNAASPSTTWVALSSPGSRLLNLGLGGGCLLDASTARALRDAPADVVSLELGINVVNSDAMRLRAFTPAVHGFLDTVREGHPDTPLLVVTPLYCALHEQTPGPGAFDLDALARGEVRFRATGSAEPGRLTLSALREELARVVRQRQEDDPNLFLVDGLELFGAADEAAHPLPDALHLDPAGHRLVAERFTPHLAPHLR